MTNLIISINKKIRGEILGFFLNVGVRRLELPTPCTPCKYASQLRHTPFFFEAAKVQKFPFAILLFQKNLFFTKRCFRKPFPIQNHHQNSIATSYYKTT